MKISKLKKGARPTLLETDKGNELIDHINSIAGMEVKRGSTDDKFVFGVEKCTLHLQDFPTNTSSSPGELQSQDESIRITEIVNEPTDIKGLTLNEIKAEDAFIVSEDKSTKIVTENNEIDLKTLTLNGIKAEDANLRSMDNSTKVMRVGNEIDLKSLTLNDIKAKDATIPETDSVGVITTPANQIELKSLRINGIGKTDANIKSPDASIAVNTVANSINLKALTVNNIKATNATITNGNGGINVETQGKNISISNTQKETVIQSSDQTVGVLHQIVNNQREYDLSALSLNGIADATATITGGIGNQVVTDSQTNQITVNGISLNGLKAKAVSIVAGTGIDVTVGESNITISLEPEVKNYKDIIVCENGVQKTYKVRVY